MDISRPRAIPLSGEGVAYDPAVPQDEAAFNTLYAGEKRRLFNLAYSILRERAEAEDAVQETMWRLWRHWDDVSDPSARGAWMTTVCVRQCLRQRKSLLRRLLGPSVDEAIPAAPDAALDPEFIVLDGAFRALSMKQRTALVLRYGYGYPVDECATLMRCGSGTVHTHVSRGLAALRRDLAHD